MNIQEQDMREASEIQDALTLIKDCSNRVIDAVIKELEDEKAEREQARKAHEINA